MTGSSCRPSAAEFPNGHAELALAAIDDDEVRQDDFRAALAGEPALGLDGVFLGKFQIGIGGGVFQQDARVAAADHLGHRGEIVLALDGADPVAAVVLVVRPAVGEAHHRGDDVVGGDVGDVEALHHARRPGEVEFLAEFREVFGGFDGGRHAAAAAELAGGREGFLQVLEDVAQGGGFFEIERLGGGLHVLAQAVEEFALALSFEDPAGFLDAFEIGLAGDAPDARGGAIADDVRVAMAVVGFARDAAAGRRAGRGCG